MNQLSLQFLGTPSASYGKQPLVFATRKAFAILIYLAVEQTVQSREVLTALLWPESDPARARGSLRNTLGYLRTALRAGGGDDHLLVKRETLAFDLSSAFTLDTQVLERAVRGSLPRTPPRERLEASSRLVRGSLPPGASDEPTLWDALERYRGDFLEGFALSGAPEFDNWASTRREQFHRQMVSIGDRLSQLQFERGDRAAALQSASRWLAHDALNELAYERVMQIRWAAGERSAALQTYEACRAVLARELHTEPSAPLQALAERIRRERPPPSTPPAPPLAGPAARPTAAEAPFVGRAEEFQQLVAAYHTARAHQPWVMMLAGEAGIGKTRLASEFLNWARAQGAQTLQARAFENFGHVPYQLWSDALRAYARNGGSLLGGIAPLWLSELARLLPELREQYPALPPPLAADETLRARLCESVTCVGDALAASAPLIVFMDDVQWADTASLDLLQYAARRWRENGAAVLLLFTVRSENVPAAERAPDQPGLANWLAGLQRDLPFSRITLDMLSAADTARLVSALGAADAESDALSRRLYAETQGQPFYLWETVKALLERSGAARAGDGSATLGAERMGASALIPSSVSDLIHARLQRLTPAAIALLNAGAVLGRAFNFEEAMAIAGLDENDGLRALDELTHKGIVRERPDAAAGRLSIAHDKIRAVVYAEAGEARRRVYHRRALETLAQRGAAPSELAHHAIAADVRDAIAPHSAAAGDAALRLYALRDAIAHYEQARRYLPHPALAAVHLAVQLGRAYELNGQFEQARLIYRELLDSSRAAGDLRAECTALNRLALLTAQNPGDPHAARALLDESLRAAEQLADPLLLAETEWHAAQIAYYCVDVSAARVHAQRALTLARELDAPDLIARSLNVLAYARRGAGSWSDAEAHAAEARALFAELGNRAMEADCLNVIANARIHLGRLANALAAAQTARALSIQIENGWSKVFSEVNLAQAYGDRAEYEPALQYAEQAVAGARVLGVPSLLVAALSVQGAVQRALAHIPAAREAHREAQVVNDAISPPPFTAWLSAELCADEAAAHAWPDAYEAALNALRHPESSYHFFEQFQLHDVVRALLHAGDIARAGERVQSVGETIGREERAAVSYWRANAWLARARGEHRAALAALDRALALARRIGLPAEVAQCEATRADFIRTEGADAPGQAQPP